MILAPYGQIPGAYPNEIGYSYGPNGTYLCPHDPQFNSRGEAGFYYDTPLGGLREAGCSWNAPCSQNPCCESRTGAAIKPTIASRIRAAMARRAAKKALSGLGSIPTDAELATIYGYTPVNSGWIQTTQGYYPGPYVPPNGYRPAGAFGPQGLRDAVVSPAPTSAADVLQALNDHNSKVLALTAAGTLIAGIAAMLTIVRTVKLMKTEG